MSDTDKQKKIKEEPVKPFTLLTSCKIVLKEIYPQVFFNYDRTKIRLSEWYEFENNNVSCFLKCSNGIKSEIFNFYKKGLNHINEAYCICRFETKFIVCKVTNCRNVDKIVITIKDSKPTVNKECTLSELDVWPIDIDIEIWGKYDTVQDKINSILSRAKNTNEKAIRSLLEEQNQYCFYCGITQEQIKELDDREKNIQSKDQLYINLLREDQLEKNPGLTKRDHRKTLEVDQKDPHGGYVEGNIVLACSWCNNAKTDTFTCDEFKEIAKGINIAWNTRLGGNGFDDIIKFPTNKC